MHHLLTKILDSVLPPREGVKLLRNMAYDEFVLKASLNKECPWAETVFDYKDQIVRQVLWEAKYHANPKAINFLARALYDVLIDILADDLMPTKNSSPTLVPIPPSKARKKKYGFNTPDLLIDEIIRLDENSIFQKRNLLERKLEVPRQTDIKNKRERIRNAKGVFEATKDSDNLKSAKVFVIDDVTTTGATLRDAKRALKEVGVSNITLIAVAH